MKAIVYEEYGGPDVLHVEDVEKPKPAKDQVLVSVRAVEATKSDCEMRSFKFAVSWFWLPLRIMLGLRKPRNPILGNYFAGVIEATGNDVSKFQNGQNVFGAAGLRMGAYAEHLCIADSCTMVTMPINMSFAGEREEELLELKRMIAAGKIAATVDKIYPMAEAAEAHRRVETEQRLGTVAISVGGEEKG